MAYVKTIVSTGDIITATLINDMQTQYDEAKADYEAGSFAPPANVETPAGSQAKADQAEADAIAYADANKIAKTGGTITGNLDVIGVLKNNGNGLLQCEADGGAINISNSDLNNLIDTGFYNGNNLANAPNASLDWWYIEVIRHTNENGYTSQRVTQLSGTTPVAMYFRVQRAAVWEAWKKIWHEDNDGAGSGLDADTLDLYHATDFMKNKSYGYAEYADSIPFQTALIKSIPIGSGKKYGLLTISDKQTNVKDKGGNGILVCFSDNPDTTLMVGQSLAGWDAGGAVSKRYLGYVSLDYILAGSAINGFGYSVTGGQYIRVNNISINGSNLEIEFFNNHASSSQTLNTRIDWEVW